MSTETLVYDHQTPWRLIEVYIVAFCSAVQLAQLLTAIYIVHYRDYKPFRGKQPFLLLASSLSATICFLGELHLDFLIPNTLPFFNACPLWKQWIFITFGMGLWGCVLLFRQYKLWAALIILPSRFVVNNSLSVAQVQAVGGLLLFAPNLVCSIIVTAGNWSALRTVTTESGSTMEVCLVTNKTASYGINAIIAISYLVIGAKLTYSLRKVRKAFNEFDTMRVGYLFSALSLVGYVACLFSLSVDKYYSRCVFIILNLLISNPMFWAMCGHVVILHLVNPDAGEQMFEDGLAMTEMTHRPPRRLKPGSSSASLVSGRVDVHVPASEVSADTSSSLPRIRFMLPDQQSASLEGSELNSSVASGGLRAPSQPAVYSSSMFETENEDDTDIDFRNPVPFPQ